MSARAEILTALQRTGYSAEGAASLLARADKEPHDPVPNADFLATLYGGHALVVQYGDCELIGSCQCGREFGQSTPDASLDTFVPGWEHHVMTEVTDV
ncbi:hypothetical protein ACGF1Z_31410 [Streptomyces sp. NPDC048018]|uniref:hypothetical protein n=1 Tax=Streptomyces sp. NPDC048018 TaxID=3365499 RepID=UPI0037182DD6